MTNPRSGHKKPNKIERNSTKIDLRQWFAEMDRLRSGSFMVNGRNQPITPRREIFD